MYNFQHINLFSCTRRFSYGLFILLFFSLTSSSSLANSFVEGSSVSAPLPAPPSAFFSTNRSSGCSDLVLNYPITITDGSAGATYWHYRIYREGNAVPIFDQVYLAPPAPINYSLINNSGSPIAFTIHLVVRNAANEEDTYSRVITVYPSVNAQYTQTLLGTNCDNPRQVRFTNQSSSNTIDSYYWVFGDGNTRISTVYNEVFTQNFENLTNGAVTYDVSLVAQSPFGCRDTATSQVTITSYFVPQFDVSHTVGCGPLDVTVTNRSIGDVASFTWAIAGPLAVAAVPANTNSFTRTLQNTGSSPADYTITLTVTNTGGCVKTLQKIVRVNPQVQVTFTPVNAEICDSTQITFATTLTHASLPNISYNWDFGDGASSTQKNPVHRFRNTTSAFVDRTVSLSATSEFGCTDDFTTNVRVHPYIKAEFTSSKAVICSGESITFTYLRMPSINNYQWNFNGYTDNVKPADSPVGTFVKTFVNQTGSPMNVNVVLTVTNTFGCPKTYTVPIIVNPEVTADFSWLGDSPLGCSPLDVDFTNTTTYTGGAAFNGTYYWDFDDGGTSTQTSPNHDFINDDPNSNATYNVTLTATSVHGCIDLESEVITVQPRLTAGFSIEQPDVCVPEFVFTPSSPGATEYNWDFDGLIPPENILNGNSFTRTINPTDPDILTTGTITLTVENAAGCIDITTRDITIHPFIVPDFDTDVASGCSDLEVTFSNLTTGGSLNYSWDFDDEQTYTTISNADFSHVFVNRGTADRDFDIVLTATNSNGCSEVHTETITVHPKVEASFSFSKVSVCTPFDATFVNNSLNGNEFNWDFGHLGQTATTFNKDPFTQDFDNLTPNDILNYTITLEAIDNVTGCSDVTSRSITVYPRVVADFSVDVDEGCNALDVQFTNSSTGLGSYVWDFDDGSLSTSASPLKTFSHLNRENSETFTVRLTSTNVFGCSDFIEDVITVYPLVEAAFAISDDEGCTPFTTYISNSTISSAYVYTWDFGNGDNSNLAQPDSVSYVNNLAPLAIFEPGISLETRLNPAVYPEGCPETFTDQVRVYPHIYPAFTANLDGCHPLPVEFTNQTEAFGGIGNASYLWTFGNGVESNFTDFNQNYYNASLTKDTTFNVTLRAYSEHGCADSVSQVVTVYPKPQSRMELVSDYFACSPYDVEIQNNSVGKGFGSTLEFFYEFGDGADSTTFNGANMEYYYSNQTNVVEPYTISLSILSEDGCRDTSYQTIYVYPEVTASFSFNPGDTDCSPFVVTMDNTSEHAKYYTWSFDDDLGTMSNLFEPTHRFVNNSMDDRVFNVKLTAISEFGCQNSDSLPLTVFAAPDANFAVLPPLKLYPDAQFTFQNRTFPASDTWDYTWTFGDGYGDSIMHPAPHTYQTWGPVEDDFQYLITLTVANANCSSIYSDYLTLRPPQPIAYYDANEYESCSPLIVYFDNLSEYYFTDPDALAFEWDFGDGTTSTDRDPVHTFQDSGYYNVRLTVYGDGGVSSFFSVFRVYENPVAMFAVAPQRVMLPDANVHMYNLSINGYSYLWDFGDDPPAISTARDPVHTYKSPGEYRISLRVETEFGCVDTTSMFPAVWVEEAGVIQFPNAFVPSKTGPNGGVYDEVDYKNEVFHPYADGIADYKLFIFNRWGEQIFLSEDIRIGWDGYYKGKLSPQDVYVWRAVGKFTNGKPFDIRGNVTLLR